MLQNTFNFWYPSKIMCWNIKLPIYHTALYISTQLHEKQRTFYCVCFVLTFSQEFLINTYVSIIILYCFFYFI